MTLIVWTVLAHESHFGVKRSARVWFSATESCSTPDGFETGSKRPTPRASERYVGSSNGAAAPRFDT
eukprot:2614926-Pleurochrysis_carterae.AAC.4